MSYLDDLPVDERFIPRTGPMFSRGSGVRGELATDLAIEIVAEGGWAALTMRNVAKAANVTPQAIAAWFPSVAVMRIAVARCYGDRWIRERAYLARSRVHPARREGRDLSLAELAVALIPTSWLEEVFDGIWLTIVEVGRWDESIGEIVAAIQERERDAVRDLIDPSGGHELTGRSQDELERDVDLVLALVRGMRADFAPAREGVAADRASVILAGLSRSA